MKVESNSRVSGKVLSVFAVSAILAAALLLTSGCSGNNPDVPPIASGHAGDALEYHVEEGPDDTLVLVVECSGAYTNAVTSTQLVDQDGLPVPAASWDGRLDVEEDSVQTSGRSTRSVLRDTHTGTAYVLYAANGAYGTTLSVSAVLLASGQSPS